MKDNYVSLGTLNFGKHSYNIIKSDDKILYFENNDGNYLMPIVSFNLYDNEGKSLTSVNQQFFISELVNRINIACKKGIFVNDQEIVEYLSNLKSKIENDSELKRLFKGSLMKEIDEDNFEKNKKDLLVFLDKYRFDTFVDYNNVSIFNGSLEKNNSSSNISDNGVDSSNNSESSSLIDSSNVQSIDSAQEEKNISNESSIVDVNEFFDISSDFNHINKDEKIESVDSSEYFKEKSVNNSINQISDFNNSNVINDLNSGVQDSFNEIPTGDSIQDINNTLVDDSKNVDLSQVYWDNSTDNVQTNQDVGNSDSSSSSYIDQVKSRIENRNLDNSKYDSEIGIMKTPVDELSLDKTFIADKESLPELESVVDEKNLPELEDTTNENTSIPSSKNGSVGFIIFIIVLVVLLILFTFFLYNYVF